MSHATHVPPLFPQNWFVFPLWQVVPSQQPLGQLCGVQTQEPPTQVCPELHAWPQVPQLVTSVLRLRQAPRSVVVTPQGVSPVGHTQTPVVQFAPVGH